METRRTRRRYEGRKTKPSSCSFASSWFNSFSLSAALCGSAMSPRFADHAREKTAAGCRGLPQVTRWSEWDYIGSTGRKMGRLRHGYAAARRNTYSRMPMSRTPNAFMPPHHWGAGRARSVLCMSIRGAGYVCPLSDERVRRAARDVRVSCCPWSARSLSDDRKPNGQRSTDNAGRIRWNSVRWAAPACVFPRSAMEVGRLAGCSSRGVMTSSGGPLHGHWTRALPNQWC